MEQSWEGEPSLLYVLTFQENKSTVQERFTVERGHTRHFRGVCVCVCAPLYPSSHPFLMVRNFIVMSR